MQGTQKSTGTFFRDASSAKVTSNKLRQGSWGTFCVFGNGLIKNVLIGKVSKDASYVYERSNDIFNVIFQKAWSKTAVSVPSFDMQQIRT